MFKTYSRLQLRDKRLFTKFQLKSTSLMNNQNNFCFKTPIKTALKSEIKILLIKFNNQSIYRQAKENLTKSSSSMETQSPIKTNKTILNCPKNSKDQFNNKNLITMVILFSLSTKS
jgi:hypothetical protein